MSKYFSANYARKFVVVIDLFVEQYNNENKSSIKMTPKEENRTEN